MKYAPFSFLRNGSQLHGGTWGESGPVVLCSHGITGNHVSFQPVADALGSGYRMVALDHRGRARSNGVGAPWGMDQHADDLMAALDHLGIQKADVIVGQSMGGFVSAVAGAKYPQRIGSILLVDGGLPLVESVPWFLPAGLFLNLLLGPAMKRLAMTFESRDAYRDFWRAHPALKDDWCNYLEQYLDYDLIGEAPSFRSSTQRDAVVGDTRSMMSGKLIPKSLEQLTMPVRLLRAPRGLQNGKALYTEKLVAKWSKRIKRFSATTVPDVNHYTICLAPRGAKVIAQEIRALA